MSETVYADLDEIVFEGRAKEYGAYTMRKRYNRLLERAALIAFILFIFFTGLPKIGQWVGWGKDDEISEDLIVTPVQLTDLAEPPPLEEEAPPPPPIDVPPPVRAQIEFKVPTPKPDEEVLEEETIKEMDELEDAKADIGTTDVEGTTGAYDFGDIDSKGVEEVVVKDDKEIGPSEFVLLEKEPSPVNLDQLKGLIGYPPMAKEAEIEGKVVVRVQVDKTGQYVKHIVIKDPHPILTKAVTDKIHNLTFTPGIQAGKPIKVWVTIPFDFKLLK
jgi:periplasmic protein TonB